MKTIFLALVLIGQVFALTPAFQSIVSPIFSSPFSSYSFNVINRNNYQYSDIQTYVSPYTNNRIVYIPPPSFINQQIGISNFLNAYSGLATVPSIIRLKEYRRTIDGSANNQKHPDINRAQTGLSRHSPALYKDGRQSPISTDFQPRVVSNALGIVKNPMKTDPSNVTIAFVIWGQFLDHDVGLTQVSDQQRMPIKIPKCDPFMDVECSGNKTIPFKRSVFMPEHQIRDQMNSITGWVDGSQIYGSNEETAKRLRSFQNGRLKQGDHMMLPLEKGNKHGLNDAGDMRANQNLMLTSYHTIFVREHNRICKVIYSKDPLLTDQQIYQTARNYVIALVQKITYQDFLPILLGKQTYDEYIGKYPGYDPNIDATIEVQFTTAAFRIGHPLLVPKYPLIDRYGEIEKTMTLNQMFFRPDLLDSSTMELLLRGMSQTIAKKKDGTLINQVRNLLITDPSQRHINMDLYSLNIQRGRDHGIEKFNYMRMAYGLPSLNSFAQFAEDMESAKNLQDFYKNVNEVDPWVGILHEKSLPGGIMGETGAKIVANNFKKLRNGDRYWYQKTLPQQILKQIKATTFSEIIIRNTGILELQEDIFHYNP